MAQALGHHVISGFIGEQKVFLKGMNIQGYGRGKGKEKHKKNDIFKFMTLEIHGYTITTLPWKIQLRGGRAWDSSPAGFPPY
jgi:hypothetical protein